MTDEQLEKRVLAIWRTRRAQWVYRILRVLVKVVARAYFRVEMVGAERLATEGAFIIAAVHRSNLDGPLVTSRCPRIVRSLAKREMFPSRVGTWVSAMLGAFPVHRGAADRRSLRVAAELIGRGEPLLVFPEGSRQSGHRIGEIFGGTAFLAARSGVPVFPVGIAGTEEAMPPGARFPRRVPISIVVAEPLLPPELESGRLPSSSRNEFTVRLQEAMQATMDEAVEMTSARGGDG